MGSACGRCPSCGGADDSWGRLNAPRQKLAVPGTAAAARHRRSPLHRALTIQVVLFGGFAGGQRPSGIGYGTDQRAEHSPLESTTPWADKGGQRRRRRLRDRRRLLTVVIALIVGVIVFAMLAFVVDVGYPQHPNISLNVGNAWNDTVCIPTASSASSVNVTFVWTTSSDSMVRLLVFPWGQGPWTYHGIIIYNGIATGGSGSFVTLSADYYVVFLATGAPSLPAFVNISLSYTLPGHYLMGPDGGTSC